MSGTVTVEVPAELIKKGILEVVTRKKGRYKDFIKVVADKANKDNNEQIKNIVNQFFGVDSHKVDIHNPLKAKNPKDIHKLINQLANKKDIDPNAIQLLAVKSTEMFAQSAAIASWASAALSAAGLAATVISTVIICQKLDQISMKIDQLADEVKKLGQNQFDEMLYQPGRKLILDSKRLVGDAVRGKQLDENILVEKINEANNRLDCAIRKCSDFDMDEVLTVIYSLLPAYANLIVLYYENFYDAKYGVHQTHEDWMAIFDRLVSDDFIQNVSQHLILTKHVHNNELNDLINLQKITTQGLKAKIETTVDELQACGDIETYHQVYVLATQYASETARELQAELAKNIGADRANDFMNSVNEAIAIDIA